MVGSVESATTAAWSDNVVERMVIAVGGSDAAASFDLNR